MFGFIHSVVNIAVNEVAKEMGVPTMGTQTGAGDITAKHYDIAFRTHAVDPPRVATWLGWIKKNGFKRVSIDGRDDRLRHRPRQGDRGAEQGA